VITFTKPNVRNGMGYDIEATKNKSENAVSPQTFLVFSENV
tara:strand:+ start:3253 stop:3375 length:123 start_codon:yes stop_codon:yes gene_type:complete